MFSHRDVPVCGYVRGSLQGPLCTGPASIRTLALHWSKLQKQGGFKLPSLLVGFSMQRVSRSGEEPAQTRVFTALHSRVCSLAHAVHKKVCDGSVLNHMRTHSWCLWLRGRGEELLRAPVSASGRRNVAQQVSVSLRQCSPSLPCISNWWSRVSVVKSTPVSTRTPSIDLF